MGIVLQWLGAAGVLGAFAFSQRTVWSIHSRRYLMTNLAAGTCLCAAAILSRQWGYTLLEGAWALIALRGLWLGLHAQRAAGAARPACGGETGPTEARDDARLTTATRSSRS
ncbi:MAG: hypothetical protein M3065_19920 [Actinomycetota bacterium]|nr:hypothetical protein [Actinomycetota bacterium]